MGNREKRIRIFGEGWVIVYLSYIYSIFMVYLSYIYSIFIVCCGLLEICQKIRRSWNASLFRIFLVCERADGEVL